MSMRPDFCIVAAKLRLCLQIEPTTERQMRRTASDGSYREGTFVSQGRCLSIAICTTRVACLKLLPSMIGNSESGHSRAVRGLRVISAYCDF